MEVYMSIFVDWARKNQVELRYEFDPVFGVYMFTLTDLIAHPDSVRRIRKGISNFEILQRNYSERLTITLKTLDEMLSELRRSKHDCN